MAHGQLDVPAEDLFLAERFPLANAHAVEWPNDRVGQPILFPGALGKIFSRQFLEAIGRAGRRTAALFTFGCGPGADIFKHHGRADDVNFFQSATAVGFNGSIESGRGDAFILGQ